MTSNLVRDATNRGPRPKRDKIIRLHRPTNWTIIVQLVGQWSLISSYYFDVVLPMLLAMPNFALKIPAVIAKNSSISKSKGLSSKTNCFLRTAQRAMSHRIQVWPPQPTLIVIMLGIFSNPQTFCTSKCILNSSWLL